MSTLIPPLSGRPTATTPLFVGTGVIVLAVATFLRRQGVPLNHDSAVYVFLGHRWLEGEVPYQDFFQLNLPLPLWIYSGILGVGHLLGASPKLTFDLAFTGLMVVASGTAWAFGPKGRRSDLTLATAFAGLWLSGYHLGQREHLMLGLALPSLFLAANPSAGSTALRVGFAFVAGIGYGLKPFFLAVWACAELGAAWQEGSLRSRFRPELAVTVAAVGLVNALMLWLYPGYLSTVVPLARATYGSEAASWLRLLLHPYVLLAMLGLVTVAATSRRVEGAAPGSIPLGGAALGALVAYLAQRKGWTYHAYPALALSAIALGAALPVNGGRAGRWAGRVLGGCMAIGTFALGHRSFVLGELHYRDPELQALTSIVVEKAKGGRVLLLGDDLEFVPQAAYYGGARQVGSFAVMWMIPGFYRGQSHSTPLDYGRVVPEEAWVRARVGGDLSRRPEVVFVQSRLRPHLADVPFVFEDWLIAGPATAEPWAAYELSAETGQYRAYTLISPQEEGEE